VYSCIESISTEKTCAPSFARRAASGHPTTSDLVVTRVVPMVAAEELYAPVDDGHGAAIGAVAVWQERVVHPDAL
jgi:hypothetical protein